MNSRTYYYARVSSKEQNLDRQIAAFKALGADERDIITDKESGKDLDRKGYQALKNAMLRRGDTLVVKSLDRFRKEYPEHKDCILIAETIDNEEPKYKEYFQVCLNCGCVH